MKETAFPFVALLPKDIAISFMTLEEVEDGLMEDTIRYDTMRKLLSNRHCWLYLNNYILLSIADKNNNINKRAFGQFTRVVAIVIVNST